MGWNLIENLKGPTGPTGATGGAGPTGATGPSVWGGISGTLSAQTDLHTALDAKANLSGATFTGDVRTRSGNTGGSDVYTRNVWLAPAGFLYGADTGGARLWFIGGDSAPADYLAIGHGASPLGSGTDDFNLDLATGAITIRSLHALNYGTIVTAGLGDYDAAGAAAAALASALAADITYTDTGITITGGAKDGAVIDPSLISSESSSLSPANYAYPTGGSTWSLWVYPVPTSGIFELDVRKKSLSNTAPSGSDSICASAKPSLTGNGTNITATGSLSTWIASPIAKGEMLTVRPTTNSAGVKWWVLFIPARRAF